MFVAVLLALTVNLIIFAALMIMISCILALIVSVLGGHVTTLPSVAGGGVADPRWSARLGGLRPTQAVEHARSPTGQHDRPWQQTCVELTIVSLIALSLRIMLAHEHCRPDLCPLVRRILHPFQPQVCYRPSRWRRHLGSAEQTGWSSSSLME
jgi:hypothetical protein